MSKYFNPDSELGYVEDSAEITYLKFNNMRHTVLGCMLGDFDEQGCYYVSPLIVEELIEMPKYLVETMDNIEICRSVLQLDKHISFLITFEQDRAILSLIEKISYEANLTLNSGTYSNINEYVLDVVQTSGLINKNAIYARWNVNPFNGTVVDVFNCDSSVLQKYFNLVNKFKLRLKENTVMLKNEEELEAVEAEYFAEMMDIIKHYPKLEKAVQAQLKATIKEKHDFIKLDKPNFTKTVNEILDKVIEENKNVLSAEEKKEFQAEVHNVKNNIAIKREEIMPLRSAVAEEEKDLKTSTDKKSELEGNAEASKTEEKANEDEITSDHKEGVAVVTSQVQTKEDLTTVARENVEAQHEAAERVEERAESIENAANDQEVDNDAARAIAAVAAVVATIVTLTTLAVTALMDENKEQRTENRADPTKQETAQTSTDRERRASNGNASPEKQETTTSQQTRSGQQTSGAANNNQNITDVPWASNTTRQNSTPTPALSTQGNAREITNNNANTETNTHPTTNSDYDYTPIKPPNNGNTMQGNGLIGGTRINNSGTNTNRNGQNNPMLRSYIKKEGSGRSVTSGNNRSVDPNANGNSREAGQNAHGV